jgi:phosphatidate cytidylyltransferase
MATMSNFWQRVFTGILFLIVMIGSIVLSFQSFVALFGVVMLLSIYEYNKITSVFTSPNKVMLYVAGVIVYGWIAFALLYQFPDVYDKPILRFFKHLMSQRLLIFLCFLFPVFIFIAEIFRKHERQFENAAYTILGFFYVIIPFVLLIQTFAPVIGNYQYQTTLSYFLLLWISDVFAYVWGKLLGKHKLAPRISKGKTIEGTVGGILTTMGLSFLGPTVFPNVGFTLIEWIIFAGLISVFAVPGDLSESLLKRQAGVKDSGRMLPGHGGILDRFDSVLLTAPVIYIYIQITTHL